MSEYIPYTEEKWVMSHIQRSHDSRENVWDLREWVTTCQYIPQHLLFSPFDILYLCPFQGYKFSHIVTHSELGYILTYSDSHRHITSDEEKMHSYIHTCQNITQLLYIYVRGGGDLLIHTYFDIYVYYAYMHVYYTSEHTPTPEYICLRKRRFTHTCILTYVCLLHIRTYSHSCVSMSEEEEIYSCIHTYIYICTTNQNIPQYINVYNTYIYICIYLYIHTCIHLFQRERGGVYTDIYMCVYRHIYVYIQTYICVCREDVRMFTTHQNIPQLLYIYAREGGDLFIKT